MTDVIKKREGPIYDLMRAYSQLTYGNVFPRVIAGYAARKWVHEYARRHSSFPHCEDRYGKTLIERGDVPEDTFKFFLDNDVKEMIMAGYRERMSRIFEPQVSPPDLEAILVKVPIENPIP
jgi:hypothetical protein